MPRKTKTKQKQKQTQKQNVKQTVIIRIDKEGKRKKRKRAKKQKASSEGGKEQYQMTAPPLPPNVIYQSSQYIPSPYESPTVNQATKATQATIPLKSQSIQAGTPASMFQDVGVGREGFIRILEPPEPEYISLVSNPKKPSDYISTEEIDPVENIIRPPNMMSYTEQRISIPPAFEQPIYSSPIQQTLTDQQNIPLERTTFSDIMQNQIAPKVPTRLNVITETSVAKIKKQNKEMEKMEKIENKQMGMEDIFSTKIGASEYNFLPEERVRGAIEAQQQELEKIQSKKPLGSAKDEGGYTSGYGSGYKQQEGKKISENWFKLTEELNSLTGSNLTASQSKYAYKNLKALRGFISIAKSRNKKPK